MRDERDRKKEGEMEKEKRMTVESALRVLGVQQIDGKTYQIIGLPHTIHDRFSADDILDRCNYDCDCGLDQPCCHALFLEQAKRVAADLLPKTHRPYEEPNGFVAP